MDRISYNRGNSLRFSSMLSKTIPRSKSNTDILVYLHGQMKPRRQTCDWVLCCILTLTNMLSRRSGTNPYWNNQPFAWLFGRNTRTPKNAIKPETSPWKESELFSANSNTIKSKISSRMLVYLSTLYLRNKTSVPIFYRWIKYGYEFGFVCRL